ncbi:MAG TPA: hypothetical protein VE077_10725 [Candidatus Methylomirabilis sp.]|nr:hypothetical protein [Candidatus Methylomirabilis sp.]
MNGIGPTSEDAHSSVVKCRFGFELAGLGEHEKKMREGSEEVKRQGKKGKIDAEKKRGRRIAEREE